MKKHQVTFSGIKKYIDSEQVVLASAFQREDNKQLKLKLSGGYVVYHQSVQVLETDQLIVAIQKYNSL